MNLTQKKYLQVFYVLACLTGIAYYLLSGSFDEQAPLDKKVSNDANLDEQNANTAEISEQPSQTVPSEKVLPYKSEYGPLPSTLEGTIMQQALAVDEQGDLRISSDLKRVYDYFLSTIEEEDLSVIISRIEEYLDYHLDEPALSQAKNNMDQYIALKRALFEFESERSESIKDIMLQGGSLKGETYLSLLKEQLEAQRDLRSLHLSPETHDAFYADEEVYDQYSLARMEVKANKGLTEEEKQLRLAEIDAQAPQEIVESRRESQITDILKEKTQALKEAGASQQDIKTLRTEMLGEEAAERFDALDKERADWNKRVNDYLEKREAILSNDGLSQQAKQDQINRIRQNDFDSREQIRVGVYERKADAVK